MFLQKLLCIIAFSSLVLSADTDFRFAFPQSELLLGVDMKWLLKSPFGETLRKELKGNMGELKPLESMMEQIESIHLSAVSKNAKGSDLLMLIQGRFEAEKLVELAARNGFRMEQWGKIKVLLPAKSKLGPTKKPMMQKVQFSLEMPASKPAFALYDNKNILIGEEAPLRVAIERMETGLTPQANPLFERARDLEAANDIWVIGNTAPLNLNAAGAKPADPMMQMASQVRNFSVGIAVRRNVSMDLQLQTTSPKAAAQMLDLVKGAVALAKMNSGPNESTPIDIDKLLQFSASGNIVKASLSIEQSDIDKLMASGIMTMANPTPKEPAFQQPAIRALSPAPVVVKPSEPVRKSVIIYGLPGGPKEIPVQ